MWNSCSPFENVPVELEVAIRTAWERLAEQMPKTLIADRNRQQAFAVSLPKVLAGSPFIIEQCVRNPVLLDSLISDEALFRPISGMETRKVLASLINSVETEGELMCSLRRFRNVQMVRIAWRDIAGWGSLDETLSELTALAEACVETALQWLFDRACTTRGTPKSSRGEPQPMIVIGMGKLGAWELNFSSDIDLIFAFESEGVLDDRRKTSYGEFYTRLAQALVKVLDEATADGFVFRVDTRLRPFGDSGPLVMSFDALEHYYQTQAREWERYAMVKARVIAGDFIGGKRLEEFLRPFVYRRYLDYRAFGELRELKQKIALELRRSERPDNVKLGLGGIREVEFIGQAFQLIRGGREKGLQERRIQEVLRRLGETGHLPVPVVDKLQEAYRFLRLVENRIQQYGDKQTHELPVDSVQRASLAYVLGFDGWEAFRARFDKIRGEVHDVFEQVFASPHVSEGQTQTVNWVELDVSLLERMLKDMGYLVIDDVLPQLRTFLTSTAVRRMTPKGVAELNRLLPMLLGALLHSNKQIPVVLGRLIRLLETIASRNVYLTLLVENPLALSQLIKLAGASSWIAGYIATHPLLLDELLDSRRLYSPLSKQLLQAELRLKLRDIEVSDSEQLMSVLRQFKQQNVLRIAAADVMGVIPVMVVSDYLTFLAEAIVSVVLDEAWRMTAERHGTPPGFGDTGSVVGFGVIAYGKLGGLELSYASDLDLVFLYGGVDDAPMTNGANPISCIEFFGRVARRMIGILATKMLGGALYEIDLRLRPSGNSGLLVSSLEAYESYQFNNAWTWEQQALVRARLVAGDPDIGTSFAEIRRRSLARARDEISLRDDVSEMREKMRDNLGSRDSETFDLKQGKGGIADIEFIVQFKILSRAYEHPQLLLWTDVVRSLEALRDCGCLSIDEADVLRDAYCTYRERTHNAALLEAPAVVPDSEYSEMRSQVWSIWQSIFTSKQITN